jgi:predicted permease
MFGRGKRPQRDFAEELQAHLRLETDRLREEGYSGEEARVMAQRNLGNITQAQERFYEAHRWLWLDDLIRDVGYGLRQLRRNPGFTIVAIITLALGIGATTAIFSVVNGVLLRPLPYPSPNRLMILYENSSTSKVMSVSYPNFLDWQRQQRSFSALAIYHWADSFNLSGPTGAEVIQARMVSDGFFKILGVSPLLGRGFSAEDNHLGSNPTAILSYHFWQQRFGGNPEILGNSITMDDRSYTIIGVLPKSFWFFDHKDVYVPIGIYDRPWTKDRRERWGGCVVGRLRSGTTEGQAQADMANIARRLDAENPTADAGLGVTVTPMAHYAVQDVRSTLLLLLSAVFLVLLISCVNVANLLLSRSAAREKEMAVRAALGARRRRLVAQLLTESVLLALLGGGLGIILAISGMHGLLYYVPRHLPRAQNIGLDLRVLLFVVATSIIAGLLFGLAPTLRTSKTDLHNSLQEGRRGSTRRQGLQSGLVVAEVGLALLLLMGAGLALRTILHLNRVNTGMDTSDALIFDVSLPPAHYRSGPANRAFYKELTRRLGSLPGVQAVGTTDVMPMSGNDNEWYFYVEGRPKPQPQDMPEAMTYITSPGYQRAMGISLLRGRLFTDEDTLRSKPVVAIDNTLARNFFPHQDPLGRHLILPIKGLEAPREIIGVVEHVKHFGPASRRNWQINDAFYIPVAQIPDQFYKQIPAFNLTFVVRTSVDPQSMVASVKREVYGIDSGVAVTDVQTMNEMERTSLTAQRFTALLLGVFGAFALALASVGVYGVISYSVAQRTHEIGIRMALGAQRRDVVVWVVRQGMTLALRGVAAGLIAAVFATRFMATMLYGVKPTDPLTLGLVSLSLCMVALLACYIPARRAMNVDPITALRYE